MIALFHSKKKASSKKVVYDEMWFVSRIQKIFNVSAVKEDISYEAYQFTHDDIDESIIPIEHLKELPNPFFLQSYSYVDKNDTEWIVGIVIDGTTGELLYENWLKNEKSIAYEIHIDE